MILQRITVGVPKEIKNAEYRVALTPAGVAALKERGHKVLIEHQAGAGCGLDDGAYREAGAKIVPQAADVWAEADMIVKVKEPLPAEYGYLRADLLLFTYLHLAAAPELARALLESKVSAVAYETVQAADGSLPLLTPMSEVAGRMAPQLGAHFLEKAHGGRGVLLAGVPGVLPGRVVIVGGGVVGTNAAKMAIGLGAEVVVLDRSAERLRYLDDVFGREIKTLMSDPFNVAEAVAGADLLIGAVLVPGAKCPHIVSKEMVAGMMDGSVIVDVAIDQGGSVETIDRVTTHAEPTYEKHGVVHYAVANIPGAVPRTSTLALTNVTLPYACKLADMGLGKATADDAALARGLNTFAGQCTCQAVAESLGLSYTNARELPANTHNA